MLTRRELLKLGLAAGGGLLLPAGSLGSASAQMGPGGGGMGGGGMGGGGMGGGGMTGSSPVTEKFAKPLPVPQALTPSSWTDMSGMEYEYYELSVEEGRQTFFPDSLRLDPTPILCYRPSTAVAGAGAFPGPLIKATKGRPVAIKFINNLTADPTVVHLHGGHVPVSEDGHTMDYVYPEGTMPMEGMPPSPGFRHYLYPNNQDASTIWFHEHAMDFTASHVYYGLAGLYYITDEVEKALQLPKDEFDVPLVIQDRLFNSDGSFNYSLSNMDLMHGKQGDVILVNGAPQPYYKVAAGKYRFRILNGSNGRFYNLALSNNIPFVQIGSDGGLLSAPVSRQSIYIAPGERIEVVIDFAKSQGTSIVLKNTMGSGRTAEVMRFDVQKTAGYASPIPKKLRTITRIPQPTSVKTRTFTLGMNMMSTDPGQIFTINGKAYDHSRNDFAGDDVKLGTTEIWEFVNPMGMAHPMHVHDIMWQILDRNGSPPPAWEQGWKDTWVVPAMGRVRVIGTFNDYSCEPMSMPMAGSTMTEMDLNYYMVHCHILEHEDHGMMAQFKVLK